jgi:ribonuclease E
VNSLKQMVRLRFDETGQIIEISAEELRKQYGTVVRPEELEPVVEEPARRRDRRNREQFVGVMTPTERPVAAAAPVAVAVDTAALDAVAEGEAVEADADGIDADGTPRKRRRRGRRGGRGRNRAAGEGATDETTEPASDE